jgi:hypothetical protein
MSESEKVRRPAVSSKRNFGLTVGLQRALRGLRRVFGAGLDRRFGRLAGRGFRLIPR